MKNVGIRELVLKELVGATAEISARIVGRENGFLVIVRLASGQKTLITSRGDIRLFASLDTAASFMGDIGVLQFEVDISHYRAGRLRGPRPDRAEALKHTRTKLYQQSLGLTVRGVE
jgi:hypothetical protein